MEKLNDREVLLNLIFNQFVDSFRAQEVYYVTDYYYVTMLSRRKNP